MLLVFFITTDAYGLQGMLIIVLCIYLLMYMYVYSLNGVVSFCFITCRNILP